MLEGLVDVCPEAAGVEVGGAACPGPRGRHAGAGREAVPAVLRRRPAGGPPRRAVGGGRCGGAAGGAVRGPRRTAARPRPASQQGFRWFGNPCLLFRRVHGPHTTWSLNFEAMFYFLWNI